MFTTLLNSQSSLAVIAKRVQPNRYVLSSRDMKKPNHDIKTWSAEEWPNSGSRKVSLTPCEKVYPKVTNWSKDLDGMDLKIEACTKALKAGHAEQWSGKSAYDYMGDIRQPHPIWTRQECDDIEVTHLKPKGIAPRLAYSIVWTLRRAFDLGTGYTLGFKNDSCMMRRIAILETVAGIPGMVGGGIRHFRSLRRAERDYGWIHSLLEEAENERMHLMIVMTVYNPNPIVRLVVKCAQTLVLPFYGLGYIISPKFCHSFVGYLEEEAVKTYTQMLELMDAGKLPKWDCTAPEAARRYYHLPEGASMRDVITNIRADEAHHRELNHCLAWMKPKELNPFPPGY